MFSAAIQEALTRNGFCYRAYLKLTSCSGEEIYIRSHPDVSTPPSKTSSAEISYIGGRTQGVDCRSSRTTIGGTQFQILDFDREFTEWASTLSECSLAGTTIKYYVGDVGVPFDSYHCVSTTVVIDLDTRYKRYTFNTDDTTRLGRGDIFPEICASHFGTLFDNDTVGGTVPITNRGRRGDENPRLMFQRNVLNTDNPTGENIPDGLEYYYGTLSTLQQTTPFQPYRSRRGEEPTIYVKTRGCEIIELSPAFAKVDAREILETRSEEGENRGQVIQEFGSASTGWQYAIIGREKLGTVEADLGTRGEVIRDGEEICQALTIAGPAPWVLYAILTGCDLDQAFLGEDLQILPSEAHAGVDKKWIDLECLKPTSNGFWNQRLDFRCPDKVDAKAFMEDQILTVINAYMRIDCDGKWCLTPLPQIGDSTTEGKEINENDIISIQPLTEVYDYPTANYIAFDRDPCTGVFLNGIGEELQDETTDCVSSDPFIRQWEGVRTSFDSLRKIRSRACRELYEFAQPRWRTTIDLCLLHADVQQGDKIRVKSPLLLDYHSKTVPGRRDPFDRSKIELDRTFIVKSVDVEWLRGTVQLKVETSTKDITPQTFRRCEELGNPCGTGYCTGRQTLTVPANGIIPAGQVIELPAGNYCYLGNLQLDGKIKLTTEGTLNLAIKGVLSGSGSIETIGMGLDGGLPYPSSSARNQLNLPGYGRTQAQGGVELFELGGQFGGDFCEQKEGSICKGLDFARMSFNNPAETNGLELYGNGGCAGGAADIERNRFAAGGAGGKGGGGLVIVAYGINIADGLTLDTSGLDGQRGQCGQENRNTFCGGAGAGGSAGRILIALDGLPSNSIGDFSTYVVSQRGVTPFVESGPGRNPNPCFGTVGSTNRNRRSEEIQQIIQLTC